MQWGLCKGDVIAIRTSTSRHTPRGYVTTTYTPNEIDAIAIYCHALNRCYYLPVGLVAVKAMSTFGFRRRRTTSDSV
jgi:hypothetical protein